MLVAMSAWPPCSICCCTMASGVIWLTTVPYRAPNHPPQYRSNFFSTTRWPDRYSATVYGPLQASIPDSKYLSLPAAAVSAFGLTIQAPYIDEAINSIDAAYLTRK